MRERAFARGASLALAASVAAFAQWPARASAAEPDAGAKEPDAKEVCVTSYENAQRLRQSGQLRAAKAQLATCEAEACPRFMRDDCTKWDGEVSDAMPTIVIAARDENGHDTTAVRVIVDDVPVAEQLDGRPISVDPGQHRIRYVSGTHTVDDSFVIRQGEKNRPLSASFAPVDSPEQPTPHRSIPTATWILGGVAAVAVVSFGAFAIAGKAKEGCAPTCSQSNVDSLRRDYLIADISLGVGVIAAGAAVYFALRSHTSAAPAPAPTSAFSIEPSITSHGGDLSLHARF